LATKGDTLNQELSPEMVMAMHDRCHRILRTVKSPRNVRDLACCFSPVENEEIIKPYLNSLPNRRFNNIKFMDIDLYSGPLYGASFLAKVHEKSDRCSSEQSFAF
jgi:hypothetical protein